MLAILPKKFLRNKFRDVYRIGEDNDRISVDCIIANQAILSGAILYVIYVSFMTSDQLN